MEHIILNPFKSGLQLMLWETNPKLRNQNNEIQFHAPENQTISNGDVIKICNSGNEQYGFNFSCYEITEILNQKKANISGKNHFTAKTRWFMENNFTPPKKEELSNKPLVKN